MIDFLRSLPARLWRLVITPYEPDQRFNGHLARALSQEHPQARATVAVLAADESRRLFGVDLARRGIQPVFVKIENRSSESLRLWLTPLTFEGKPVWAGQVSRDIGVRFTTRAWNLTTHRIDPNVDESRDYVIEDLLQARRVAAAGYVEGVGGCPATAPKRNLTGDPYFTDGNRAVIMVSANRTP